MKLFIDFFPVLLFFLAYKLYDIYVATSVAIAAAIVQVSYSWWRYRKLQSMHLVTLAVLMVFGGLTIFLQDRTFIMWKPTIINWLFAVVFLGSQYIGEQNMIQRMMGHAITIPKLIWSRLNLIWVTFFIVAGTINLYIANSFFQTDHQLRTLTGLQQIDTDNCADHFTGHVLDLCTQAHLQENFWVNFKLFGMIGLTFIFAIGQALYLSRYIEEPATAEQTPPSE
ncbi:septation protein A [Achromatium sp. WMS2]|nr:septation protein A [Achromatium sp. WMS2]